MGRGDSRVAGRLVFATGCRRSGTNWLQRILTAHPGMVGMPSETHLFYEALSNVAERFQHANPGSPKTGKVFMSRDGMLDAMRDFADRVFAENLERLGPDARYLVERTPWHVYDLELIGDVYPDAHFIQIVRDGRDVARSLLSQDWGPSRMEDAAEEWRSSVTAGQRAGRGLGDRYFEVRYEDMLASPAEGIRRLYEWLGVEIDEDVLDHALAEAGGAFNVDPKAPKIAAGKWRDSLSAADLAIFQRVAGSLLAELGYDEIEPPPSGLPLEALRRRAGSARRLARRVRQRPVRQISEGEGAGYEVFDRFVTHIGAGQLDAALALLGPQAHVRVVAEGGSRAARGADALQLMRDHLAMFPELEILSGHVHPGDHTSTAVTTFALPDGRTIARTLAVSAAEGTVRSVSLFEFGLAASGEPVTAPR
jgi:hypothetical protein